MTAAVEETGIEEPYRRDMLKYFNDAATFLMNEKCLEVQEELRQLQINSGAAIYSRWLGGVSTREFRYPRRVFFFASLLALGIAAYAMFAPGECSSAQVRGLAGRGEQAQQLR